MAPAAPPPNKTLATALFLYLLFRRDLLLHQPNYIYIQGRRQEFGWGNIGQNFIHEFLSSPVLQWRRQNFASGEGHSAKIYSSKTFEKF